LVFFPVPPRPIPEPGGGLPDASGVVGSVELVVEDGRALLEAISLRLEPGSLNVLVGPSGAGKSSLLALLGRLYDVDAGRVLLGGVDIRRLSETTLAASRNLVFQDNGLFRGSVAWNLRMARADADLEALREAARAVGLLEEIEAWPQGWDSDVGPGGALLSGG
ncbi:ATP-binding cassette domain-containing protein, partial [Pseudomonas aeruginosa]